MKRLFSYFRTAQKPYDPDNWTSHLCDIEGSMVLEIISRVLASVVWATTITVLYELMPDTFLPFVIPITAHTLTGTALGLVLVFRTNSSYDRFWEGRKNWGGIVNESRNLARQSSEWLTADPRLAREVITWTFALPYSIMQRLRAEPGLGIELEGVDSTDVKQVESSKHLPLAITRLITRRLMSARRRGVIDGFQMKSMDYNIGLLIDYCGACERIRSTPLPFAYTVHLRRVLIVYCFTLPLALIKDFGWATVPATMLISYILFGIEEIGVEIEDPFGLDMNDLPLQKYCGDIQAVLEDVRNGMTEEDPLGVAAASLPKLPVETG
ncbi:bestrophin family protein [Schlesneria sp. T3-172]|uniref:bestrophin family protein n=1 Tax=Schlesneria sphaerica TaxID=3373610 RepID=UPI0037C5B0F1